MFERMTSPDQVERLVGKFQEGHIHLENVKSLPFALRKVFAKSKPLCYGSVFSKLLKRDAPPTSDVENMFTLQAPSIIDSFKSIVSDARMPFVRVFGVQVLAKPLFYELMKLCVALERTTLRLTPRLR